MPPVLLLIVLFAFATETAIGFGATVLTVSLGSFWVSLDTLLPAFVPVNMALSAYLVLRRARDIAYRVLLVQLAPALLAGLLVGLWIFRLKEFEALKLAFALFVIALAAIEIRAALRGTADAAPTSRGARLFMHGLLALGGLIHGLFGTGGPMIVYVMRRHVRDKSAYRASLALVWLCLNAALVANYAQMGLLGSQTLVRAGALLCVLGPALLLGEWIHRRFDARRFQIAVCALLLIAGVALAARTAPAILRNF